MRKIACNLKTTLANGFNLLALLLLCYTCLRVGTAMLGIDYADYYTAGRMVLEGDLSRVYDFLAHHAALERLFGDIPYLLEWVYPPTFLLPIVPLALLPFSISYPAWLVLTFIPAAFAVYYLSGKKSLRRFGICCIPAPFSTSGGGKTDS